MRVAVVTTSGGATAVVATALLKVDYHSCCFGHCTFQGVIAINTLAATVAFVFVVAIFATGHLLETLSSSLLELVRLGTTSD